MARRDFRASKIPNVSEFINIFLSSAGQTTQRKLLHCDALREIGQNVDQLEGFFDNKWDVGFDEGIIICIKSESLLCFNFQKRMKTKLFVRIKYYCRLNAMLHSLTIITLHNKHICFVKKQ